MTVATNIVFICAPHAVMRRRGVNVFYAVFFTAIFKKVVRNLCFTTCFLIFAGNSL